MARLGALTDYSPHPPCQGRPMGRHYPPFKIKKSSDNFSDSLINLLIRGQSDGLLADFGIRGETSTNYQKHEILHGGGNTSYCQFKRETRGLRRRDTVCVLGVQRGARDAANTLFDTKILLCQLYGLWGYSEGIGMAAIRSPGTCREVRADWGLITGNTLSACVRPERDAQWPCSGARSTPHPPVGLW